MCCLDIFLACSVQDAYLYILFGHSCMQDFQVRQLMLPRLGLSSSDKIKTLPQKCYNMRQLSQAVASAPFPQCSTV